VFHIVVADFESASFTGLSPDVSGFSTAPCEPTIFVYVSLRTHSSELAGL
jgi:hypothetical protein